MVMHGRGVAANDRVDVFDEGGHPASKAPQIRRRTGCSGRHRLSMRGLGCIIPRVRRRVNLPQRFEVRIAEVGRGDVGVQRDPQLAPGFVRPALVDRKSGDYVSCGATQGRGDRGGIANGNGPVGPAEELAGFGLVVGDGSHVGFGLLGVRGRITGMKRMYRDIQDFV